MRLKANSILLLLLMLAGCSRARDPWEGTPPGQTRVLAVFPPLYCFAANVAGDKARVMCLLTGTGPHEYEATTNDALKVAGAEVFLVNGLSLEQDFSRRLLQMARTKTLKADPIGDAIDRSLLRKMAPHDHSHDDDHHHHHGEFDPHVWLGPKQAKSMVAAISDKLAQRDPARKDEFAKNAADYSAKIDELEAYGRGKFKDKKSKSFVAMHESLGYFAEAFGLDLVDAIQPRAGVEADANQLARLVDVCRKRNVAAIAVEPQYSAGQAESLARALKNKGVDVRIAFVDPMETATPDANGNPSPSFYLDQMKANIDALAGALP